MGRVKAWAESEFEKSLALREEQAGFGAQSNSDGDAPSSNWELEFNEWLDAYEKSFGNGGKFYD